MLHLSKKGIEMPPSPIRKLVPYAEAAKKRGTKVYHLNIGQPDIDTPQVAIDAVRSITDKVFEYTHSAGMETYRRKLAEYYQKAGIDVTYDQLMATVGGSEALFMAFTVCVDEGDEILCPEPFYANYNGFAVEAGVVIKPIRSTIENDFALPAMEEFEKLIGPRTRAILICNPNNPTGYVYSREELEKLAEIVKKHNLYLISDEVYREFCYDGIEHFSVMNLRGVEQNVIMTDSVSKRYSMCGVRLGALVTRNKEVFDAAMKMAQARLSPPYLAQVAGLAAVDTPQSYFDEVIGEYKLRRDLFVELLNRIPGVYCPMPKGAFYATAQLPIDDCDRFAQWLLEEFSYEGQTVMLAPATGFYSTKGIGLSEVRIAYVLNRDDLTAAAKCLEEALKVYPGRTL
ncbi:MAG: pyridoxal phosphate-dependent aminotransferase [Rikenellaceae bacterium]|nr:pyridoxal phosphate-dependent aminotransferase [Rikenellaceae bacterium]MCL2692219.1 pyridoxal phosphate-dependent aminotransferase [Rikenellaceae bacterium]